MAKKKILTNAALTTQHETTARVTDTPLITGYQYGDHGTYIGTYSFQKNRDSEQVHCPPFTTLLAPPTNLAPDEETYFDGQQWQVRRLTLAWLPDRELPQPEEDHHDH
jgi:hypothetical protein